MSQDLANQNANEMSMGQLQGAHQQMQGAILEAAKSMNEGKAPVFAGAGDSLASDMMSSSFMGGGKGAVIMGAAAAAHENMGGASRFMPSDYATRKGRDVQRNAFGHRYTYAEQKAMVKREVREMSYIARTGRAPKRRDDDGVLRRSNGVFEQTQITSMSIGPGGYMPKMAKFTPQMLINLKLLPQVIKDNADHIQKVMEAPKTEQIMAGFRQGEQSGEDLFRKSSAMVQEDVSRNLSEPTREKLQNVTKPKAQKPPAGPATPQTNRRGDFLH